MKRIFKRVAVIAAVALVALVPATAASASTEWSCGGTSCMTPFMASNYPYRCLSYYVQPAWLTGMSYGIWDQDSGQYILQGHLNAWDSTREGTIHGLYGHYEAFIYNGGWGALIAISDDCT